VNVEPQDVSRLAVTLACLAFTSPVRAQDACRFVCAPALKVEPTITSSNLLKPHLTRTLPDGEPRRVSRETAFELILALDIPTEAFKWVHRYGGSGASRSRVRSIMWLRDCRELATS
jgi:hypothetical protein